MTRSRKNDGAWRNTTPAATLRVRNRRHNVMLRTAALAALLLLGACGRDALTGQAAVEDVPVRVETTTTRVLTETLKAIGQLAPRDQRRLSFKVGGVIQSADFEQGQPVRAGQELAVLRGTEVAAGVEQARQAAQKAERDLARGRALYADGVATKEQLQDLGTAAQMAQASLRSAEFNASFARIEAPCDGVVLAKLAQPGELVGPGQPVVIVGATDRGWVVKASLTDRQVVHVMPGNRGRVSFDAFPDREFEVEVSTVASAADPRSGTFEVELAIAQPADVRFAQGLIGRVRLEQPVAHAAALPVIPVAALLEGEGERATVYVLAPDGQTARLVPVRIGRMVGGIVEVREGLRSGDRVVVEGAAYLHDGTRVHVIETVEAAGTNP